ncbi:MAG: GAF domain-containing protein [Candidatus Acidiferrales bacterium]
MSVEETLNKLVFMAGGDGDRPARAQQIAHSIRALASYRWVGVYDVGTELVSIIGWSGPGAPAYPTFPVTKGLTGSAIQQKATVIAADVRNDPRYLTAFGSTLSEIIIPILDPRDSRVVGTIDVESERVQCVFRRGSKNAGAMCGGGRRVLAP